MCESSHLVAVVAIWILARLILYKSFLYILFKVISEGVVSGWLVMLVSPPPSEVGTAKLSEASPVVFRGTGKTFQKLF